MEDGAPNGLPIAGDEAGLLDGADESNGQILSAAAAAAAAAATVLPPPSEIMAPSSRDLTSWFPPSSSDCCHCRFFTNHIFKLFLSIPHCEPIFSLFVQSFTEDERRLTISSIDAQVKTVDPLLFSNHQLNINLNYKYGLSWFPPNSLILIPFFLSVSKVVAWKMIRHHLAVVAVLSFFVSIVRHVV